MKLEHDVFEFVRFDLFNKLLRDNGNTTVFHHFVYQR